MDVSFRSSKRACHCKICFLLRHVNFELRKVCILDSNGENYMVLTFPGNRTEG